MNTKLNRATRIAAIALALAASSAAFAGDSINVGARTWGFIAEVVDVSYHPVIRFIPAVVPMPEDVLAPALECDRLGTCTSTGGSDSLPTDSSFQLRDDTVGTMPEDGPKQRPHRSEFGR
jgi:hypothetical protein